MEMMRLFSYRARPSPLHNMDARCKLLCLIVLQSATLLGHVVALPVLIAGMVWLYHRARIALGRELRSLRFFMLIAALIALTRSLSVEGTIIVSWGAIGISDRGLASGLLYGTRLIVAALYGNLYVSVTPMVAIIDTLHWCLRPLGRRFAGRIALMLGLTLSFYPLLMRDIATTREALVLRGLNMRRHPLHTTRYIGYNTIANIGRRCQHIVDALEARCYSDTRSLPAFGTAPRYWSITIAIMLGTVAACVYAGHDILDFARTLVWG